MITSTTLHPLTSSAVATMQSAHETITDESSSLKTRRLALLMFEAMDDALARYHNEFKVDEAQAAIDDYTTTVAELPSIDLKQFFEAA